MSKVRLMFQFDDRRYFAPLVENAEAAELVRRMHDKPHELLFPKDYSWSVHPQKIIFVHPMDAADFDAMMQQQAMVAQAQMQAIQQQQGHTHPPAPTSPWHGGKGGSFFSGN